MLSKLRNILFCVLLAASSIQGVPMRADEVESLMAAMREPKVAHTLPDENQAGDDD